MGDWIITVDSKYRKGVPVRDACLGMAQVSRQHTGKVGPPCAIPVSMRGFLTTCNSNFTQQVENLEKCKLERNKDTGAISEPGEMIRRAKNCQIEEGRKERANSMDTEWLQRSTLAGGSIRDQGAAEELEGTSEPEENKTIKQAGKEMQKQLEEKVG